MNNQFNNEYIFFQKLLKLLILFSFSFSFILKGIVSLVFFLITLFGIIFSINIFKKINLKNYELILIGLLILNFIAIVLNQIYNGEFYLKEYDYGVRFIAAIFVYFLISRLKLNLNKQMIFGAILSIIFVGISFIFLYRNNIFDTRTHTTFVDPNTICVYLAIFTIIIIPVNWKVNNIKLIILSFIIGLAIYLIIESRSRGGWLGFAVAIFYIAYNAFIKKEFKIIYLLLVITVSILLYYLFNDSFSSRFNSIAIEIGERIYGNHNTSAGDRITLGFLGLDLLSNHYLFGINYSNARVIIEYLELNQKYQSHIFDIFYCCGFHNQYITILVKYGLFGLLSFLSLFIYLYYLNIKYKNDLSVKIIAIMFIFLISSLSLETISLKYTQSIFLLLLIYGYAKTFLEIESQARAK